MPIYSIVVDNGSSGPDVNQIRESGLADTVIAVGENLGFAEGNNIGLRWALESSLNFDVVGVLNNDTLVDPRCFVGIVKQLRSADGRNQAVAPTIGYADEPTRTWFAGGIVDRGRPRHLQPAELHFGDKPFVESEWLTGCCIMTRAETWRRVGLFDPRYYLIFEDCDWSLRARRRGVDLRVAARSTIRHKVSRSFASGPSSLLGHYYSTRNGLLFQSTYARRYLPGFVARQLIQPTVSDFVRLCFRPGLGFRWLGAVAFVTRHRGRAQTFVVRLAQRRALERVPAPQAREPRGP